jgi:4-carboxymuconolactone decarboxylase
VTDDRHQRGWKTLRRVNPEAADALFTQLQDIAPDFAGFVVDFAFGDVVARPGLDLRTRELATVAALAALGTAAPQLKAHIRGALNAGARREEVVEVIMQMAVYAGFPAAINGLMLAKEAFAEAEPPAPAVTSPPAERPGTERTDTQDT